MRNGIYGHTELRGIDVPLPDNSDVKFERLELHSTTLPPPSVPMAVARAYIEDRIRDGVPTLRHWRGGWWQWQQSHWREIEHRTVRAALYDFTEQASYENDDGKTKAWAPNRRKIGDLTEALAAICHLPDYTNQPSWLDSRMTGVIVACTNGLLDVERRQLMPHTPLFFNQTAVPFGYDPQARPPERWLSFLWQLWSGEPAAIDVLAEWFGYVVSGRTDLHKILLMVGPTRGGKGVIARTLGALIGRENVAGPTLSSLGGEFGLAPLIGKPLAVISDARFTGKNSNVVVERLLSISGEDALTVNIKHKEQWTGKLPSRLHVISNELPKLGDASTAIIGRIVLLLLTNSWLGKEDHGLERKLQAELTGILNWSLAGLHRLTVNNANRFTHLPSADEAIIAMRDLASPVAAFVREQCEIGPDKSVAVDLLYAQYKIWAENNGHPKPAKHVFGRDLSAAVSSIGVKQQGSRPDRIRVYVGIGLSEMSDTNRNENLPVYPVHADVCAHGARDTQAKSHCGVYPIVRPEEAHRTVDALVSNGCQVQPSDQNPLIYDEFVLSNGSDGLGPALSGAANAPALGPPGDNLDDFR